MNERYMIRHLPEACGALKLRGEFDPQALPAPWSGLDEARLEQYPWGGEYRPPCAARVGWNQAGLHVLMYAREPQIRALETRVGGDVYLDSCLEFFVGFDPAKPKYLNCECNPMGVMHIGVGEGRHGRTVCQTVPEGFEITHSEHRAGWWAVSYTIPAEFIAEHFGATLRRGMPLKGNFYCCGDDARHAHYGMYKGYDLPAPDYHRPELFADMRLGAPIPEVIRDIEPFRLWGNVYFVGSSSVSVHLIDTGEGLIMIDTGYPYMRDAILENMRILGFDPSQIRILLHSHAHYDHYANTAYYKSLSGAKTYISRIDGEVVNGHMDLSLAVEGGYDPIPPFDCDVLLDDGDTVALGNTRILCRLAPGHTDGVMCFFFDIHDGDRTLRAAMHGGIGMNAMRLDAMRRHGRDLAARRRFRADLEVLREIPVDVVLGNHPHQSRTEEKLARLRAGEADAFVDPAGWRRLMDECARKYDEMVAAEGEE